MIRYHDVTSSTASCHQYTERIGPTICTHAARRAVVIAAREPFLFFRAADRRGLLIFQPWPAIGQV